jgi:hypothetical protein
MCTVAQDLMSMVALRNAKMLSAAHVRLSMDGHKNDAVAKVAKLDQIKCGCAAIVKNTKTIFASIPTKCFQRSSVYHATQKVLTFTKNVWAMAIATENTWFVTMIMIRTANHAGTRMHHKLIKSAATAGQVLERKRGFWSSRAIPASSLFALSLPAMVKAKAVAVCLSVRYAAYTNASAAKGFLCATHAVSLAARRAANANVQSCGRRRS